ncbi:insulin-like growth factor-binding protein complex acid labile subunit [Portunus trituberculatus]|uniref:insulin-like growth factor-binding protein complex acid labile subunit n=1 Tax=Portunus trituberculatus TaxID=210409 RepID=UPI001E1CFE97|nr:insulin-like growth factor-binding protein complex acid labile subunit [Portunus trituberculatus]
MLRWCVVWACLAGVARAFCPPGCNCDDNVPSARCVGVGLNVLPILFNPRLRRLNMAHNLISSLNDGLVFFDRLEELDLSNNALTYLGTENFVEQVRLQELRLAHNNLTTLTPGAFRGLNSLTLLDLSHNGLIDLQPGMLEDAPRLTVLLLAHNKLHVLVRHTFRGLRSLHVLDLCDNYFRDVPSSALGDLQSLKSLHMCRNRLTRLEPDAFTNPALTSLSLETNNIDHIEAGALQRLKNLQKLNLNDNLLREVPAAVLSLLVMLDTLILNKNNFTTIQAEAFRSLSRLTTLEISRCPRLASLHPNAFAHCSNLQRLTISHNPLIRHLPERLFTSLPRLHMLDLRANSLKSVSEVSMPWGSLAHLDLRDNQLVCNCSIRWLAALLGAANTSLAAPDVQCASPEKLKGLYLSRLSPSEQLCVDQVQVVVGIVVVTVSTVLLMALSVLLCKYRRRNQRDKMGRMWPPGPLAPWPPDNHTAPTRHIMADEYVYHTYSSVRKIPVTKV